ncbi:MAG TPA: histone deacetylase [Acidimicrobiales bacterium]|nr:histone deacetylase [Acidimicrobiales bacterium]
MSEAKLLVLSHPACLEHAAGYGHPERPERVEASVTGIRRAGLDDSLVWVEPREATVEELSVVHEAGYVEAMRDFCARGGGRIDMDTSAVRQSWRAAVVATGSGLDAVERLDRGQADAAFCAIRPPGHHATERRAMGFCLFNNAAVCAGALAERGERVLIVDWDVHHGNGTQDIFYEDPRVFYLSLHQWPLYPGTGRMEERGGGAGEGLTVNFPVPVGATGDVFLAALDVVTPAIERFGPTWVLVSCGFDSHADDLLGSLALREGDYADLTRRCAGLVPRRRCILFLEGGYNTDAIAASSASCAAALVGVDSDGTRTTGGPGMEVVEEVGTILGS